MFGIITIKGNASSSRKASRWLVKRAVNASAAYNCIGMAQATGSVGAIDIRDETWKDGTKKVLAEVHRLCNTCGKPCGVYGAGHEDCKEWLYVNKPHEIERNKEGM